MELIRLHSSLLLDNSPWLIGGDFNQIIHPGEHSSPSVSALDNQMFVMRDCLTQTGAFDLRFNGPTLTWTNNQPASPIAKKLNRLLVNAMAIATFPHAAATFLPQLFSDHCPCLLDLAVNLPTAGTRPFKFQNYLTKHPGFSKVVNDSWSCAGSMCSNLSQFCWKLKSLKGELKRLN